MTRPQTVSNRYQGSQIPPTHLSAPAAPEMTAGDPSMIHIYLIIHLCFPPLSLAPVLLALKLTTTLTPAQVISLQRCAAFTLSMPSFTNTLCLLIRFLGLFCEAVIKLVNLFYYYYLIRLFTWCLFPTGNKSASLLSPY